VDAAHYPVCWRTRNAVRQLVWIVSMLPVRGRRVLRFFIGEGFSTPLGSVLRSTPWFSRQSHAGRWAVVFPVSAGGRLKLRVSVLRM
jgi:hypothetical protein